MPVVRPEAYRDKTAWILTYMAVTLNVSNMICVMRSRLALGFKEVLKQVQLSANFLARSKTRSANLLVDGVISACKIVCGVL